MTTITSRVLIKFWGGGKAVTQGFWAGILKNGMGTSRMHRLENKGRVRDRPPPSVGHLISARRLVSSGESRVKGGDLRRRAACDGPLSIKNLEFSSTTVWIPESVFKFRFC